GGVDVVARAVVDVDVVVAPAAAATPVVAPASDRPAGAEGKTGRDHAGADIGRIAEVIGRVTRVRPCAIDGGRIIIRDIDRVGLRRFNHNVVLVVLLPNADFLLLAGD